MIAPPTSAGEESRRSAAVKFALENMEKEHQKSNARKVC